EYEIKSEATELALSDELKKIGSSAADVDFGSNENKIRSLVTYLENRLASDTPSRSDYSKVRRDVYQDENGNPVTIEYDYQTVMKHLMGMIFSGELSGINAENLAENLSVFASSVYSLADAVKGEDTDDAVTVATNYHRAAQGVHNVVNGLIDGAVSLTDIDFYALLRLAGPLMLDATYEAEDDPQFDVAGYIYPTIDLAQSFGNLSYPHHFDAVIARLKTLAPQPKATSFAITLAEPKAEDASSLMPQAFAAGIEGLGMSWLSAKKTGWNTSAETLQSGMLYYLEATIEVVGHLAMDDFKITINGKDPIEMTSGYKDGACLVSFRWEFSVGTPEKVTLHFESGRTSDVTITPAVMLVDRGKMLKYIARPEMEKNVSEEGKKYLFADWKDESGAALDEITAKEDCTLSAHWIQIIDEVALLFNTPVLGGEAKLPSFPEDAPYILSEYHITDEDYKETDLDEVTTRAGEYHLTIFFMAIEGRSVFAEETVTYEEDDWEETVYAGTVLLNGEIYDDSYYESVEGIPFLSVYIAFTVA
ncbi:MAG: hypothetical protein J6Y74_05195, partial [Clostridia bacterium]|nr:hypothetical protein [Clostridia bacterium]